MSSVDEFAPFYLCHLRNLWISRIVIKLVSAGVAHRQMTRVKNRELIHRCRRWQRWWKDENSSTDDAD